MPEAERTNELRRLAALVEESKAYFERTGQPYTDQLRAVIRYLDRETSAACPACGNETCECVRS
jgi:hypothetical protein